MEQLRTVKGYDLFEVMSAFQKSIRRGKEADAMFWGVELHESGYIAHAWKRMLTVSIEDIGLANPYAPLIIKELKEIYEGMKRAEDKKKQYRLPYVQAILFLVHSKKCRHTDWALNYWFDSHLSACEDRPIPDYALDIHTRRGKAMGKTIKDFFSEGSKLENSVEMPSEKFYREKCKERWTDPEWCRMAEVQKEIRRNNIEKPLRNPTLFEWNYQGK